MKKVERATLSLVVAVAASVPAAPMFQCWRPEPSSAPALCSALAPPQGLTLR